MSAKFASGCEAAIIDQAKVTPASFLLSTLGQAGGERKAETVPVGTIKDNWPYQFIKTINLFRINTMLPSSATFSSSFCFPGQKSAEKGHNLKRREGDEWLERGHMCDEVKRPTVDEN